MIENKQLQDAYYLHHFISSQMKMIVKGHGHWLYRGQILSHHICFNKLIEEWRSQDFHVLISTLDGTKWKFVYLNPINYCSTLKSKLLFSYISIYRCVKFWLDNLFTYIWFKNWGKDTEKQTRNSNCSYTEIFKIYYRVSGIEIEESSRWHEMQTQDYRFSSK